MSRNDLDVRTRLVSLAIAAAVFGLLSCGRGPDAAAAPPRPATHTIVIEGMRFEPETMTVKVGDTVVWVNRDLFPHTATSKDPGFDSQSVDPGKYWQNRTDKVGDFSYFCTFHPTMRAALRVE